MRRAVDGVNFNGSLYVKSRLLKTKRQTACTGKQINAFGTKVIYIRTAH